MADENKIESKGGVGEPEIEGSISLGIAEASHEHADEALDFVEKHQGFSFTSDQDKSVLRKIDLRIMPLVSNATSTFGNT